IIAGRYFHASGTRGRHQMQFGVQFFPAVDHTDKSAADYYAESLAIAEEAERLGFTHARTVEHYFTRYGGHNPHTNRFLTRPTPPSHFFPAPPYRSARGRCVSSPARCCPYSTTRSSSPAKSRCSTAFRAGGSTSDLRARFFRTNSAASASRPMNRRRASAKASNRSNSC